VKDRLIHNWFTHEPHGGIHTLNIKNRIFATLIISLLLLFLAACRANEPIPDEVCPIDEISGEYDEDCAPIITDGEVGTDAYPVGEAAYPAEDLYIPIPEDAYPITQADLTLLLKTWRLTSYAENGIKSEPSLKTLTFKTDGSYALATETGLIQGTWTAILLAMESTLILSPDAGDVGYYQILELEEEVLNLRTVIGTIQYDEGYLPGE
jgi:hypothetical protein